MQTIWHACNVAFPSDLADPLVAAHARVEQDGRLAQLYAAFGVPLPQFQPRH